MLISNPSVTRGPGVPRITSMSNKNPTKNMPRESSSDNSKGVLDDIMTSHSFAASLLQDGKLDQTEYDKLTALIRRDLNMNTQDSFTYAIAGNVNIVQVITKSQLEAVATVFNTAELLEAILGYVPATDLITTIPRVCKGFRQAIQASLELQRQSYMIPSFSPTQGISSFPVPVPEVRLSGSRDELHLILHPWELREDHRDGGGLRAYQLARPAIKRVGIYHCHYAGEERNHREPINYVMPSEAGITFGDVYDIMKRDRYEAQYYFFLLYTALEGDGESPAAFLEWMEGGSMVFKSR